MRNIQKQGEKRMAKLKAVFSDRQRAVKMPAGIRMLLRRACTAVLKYEKFESDAEVNISFVDNSEIKTLNNKFRKIDKSTDVLSFPLGENGEYDTNPETGYKALGDIVISVEHAVAQAHEYGHTLNREMAFLTVHSMLHLLGYDHVDGGIEAIRMREHEEAVLAELGLSRDESFVDEDDEE